MQSTTINLDKLKEGNPLEQKAVEAIENKSPDILIQALEDYFHIKKGLHKTVKKYITDTLEADTIPGPFKNFRGISAAIGMIFSYEELFGKIELKNVDSEYFPGFLLANHTNGHEFYLMLETGAVWNKHHDELVEWAEFAVEKNKTQKKFNKALGGLWSKIDKYYFLQTTYYEHGLYDLWKLKDEQIKELVEAEFKVQTKINKRQTALLSYTLLIYSLKKMVDNNWLKLTAKQLEIVDQHIEEGVRLYTLHDVADRLRRNSFEDFSNQYLLPLTVTQAQSLAPEFDRIKSLYSKLKTREEAMKEFALIFGPFIQLKDWKKSSDVF